MKSGQTPGLRLPATSQALWVGLDIGLAGGLDAVAAVGVCVCAYQHGRPLEIVTTIYLCASSAEPAADGRAEPLLAPDDQRTSMVAELSVFLSVVEQTAHAWGIHVTYLAQDQSRGLAALNRLLASTDLPPIPISRGCPSPETALVDPMAMLHGALLLVDPLFDRSYDKLDALFRLAHRTDRPELEPNSSPIYGGYILAWVLYALVELRYTGCQAD